MLVAALRLALTFACWLVALWESTPRPPTEAEAADRGAPPAAAPLPHNSQLRHSERIGAEAILAA